MIVTDMAVETLVPYARNPRNNTAAIDAVKASIAEFGFRQPIVVDEKLVVIVGHTRLEAAKQLGLKTVPVHVAEGLTPAQAKAYRIMDNRSHENAEWDDELLRLEFGDLKLDDFDLALTGFVSEELDKLLESAGDDLGAAMELHEVDVSDLTDARFWMSIDGPLPSQPDALEALRKALSQMPGVKVNFVG